MASKGKQGSGTGGQIIIIPFPDTLNANHYYRFVHVLLEPFALVYVPMPPARYLSRKSPGNELAKKFAEVIVP